MNDPVSQPLQDFSFEQSQYQRPNQAVVYVPLPDGEEVITHGKELYQSPKTTNGDDAKPFFKSRSLRKRRGIFSFAMTALTLGFLLIAFNSPWSKELIAPGPLSSPHGQILGKLGSDRCAACHQAADQSFGQWMMAAAGISSANETGSVAGHDGHAGDMGMHQSQLCMKCHGETFDAALALNPHGASVELLEEMTLKAGGGGWASDLTKTVATGLGMSHGNSIACNACHREHHGNVSLSQLTDQQCQSCHQQTFHSFENGHPEFSVAPQARRQHIAFDHGSHLNKHFPSKKTSFDCAQCHVDDLANNAKLTAPFEQSCGACHQQQIADSGDRGWAMFALPMIDMEAVKQHGLNVGNWPMAATGDFDGPLPPMMGVLLAADSKSNAVLQRLGDDFAFGDIDPDDKASVGDAVELVWGIKRLLNDLAVGGRNSLRAKLSYVTGKDVSDEELTQILTGLDPQIFAATAKRWLPDLERDLAAFGGDNAVSQSDRQLRQHPNAKLNVGLVQGLLATQELLVENPLSGRSFEASSRTESIDAEPLEDEDEDEVAGYNNDSVKSDPVNSTAVRRKAYVPPAGSELLVANPLQPGGEFSRSADSSVADSPSRSASAKPNSVDSNRKKKSPLALKLPDEIQIFAQASQVTFTPGWYRSDSRFVIGYRPAEHADALAKSWSDFAAAATVATGESGGHAAMDRLFAAVTSSSGVGSCRSCHTVDRQADGGFEFQWTSKGRDTGEAQFTKFAHRPHLILPQLQDCKYCHRMDESKSLVGTFDGFDSMVATELTSNFHPSTKADCAACHRRGHTDSGCLQCHNYHAVLKRKE